MSKIKNSDITLDEKKSNLFFKIIGLKYFWPIFSISLVFLYNGIYTEDFFEISMTDGRLYGYLIDIIYRGAPYMILAIGMTFVIVTGGIDISVGSVCAIAGAIACVLLGTDVVPAMPMFLVIVIVIVVSSIIGLFNGILVSKLKIQPVVATLIFMVAGRGVAQLITQGMIPSVRYSSYSYIGGYIPGSSLPTPLFIVAVLFVLAILLTKKTALGLFLKSIGINSKASRHTGIKVSFITLIIYVFSGFCAGIAGLVVSSQVVSADANNAALYYELDAILAVALGGNLLNGGKLSLLGSLLGAITIQSLTTTLYAASVTSAQLPLIKAIIVLVICVLQTDTLQKMIMGLFNRRKSLHDKRSVTANER